MIQHSSNIPSHPDRSTLVTAPRLTGTFRPEPSTEIRLGRLPKLRTRVRFSSPALAKYLVRSSFSSQLGRPELGFSAAGHEWATTKWFTPVGSGPSRSVRCQVCPRSVRSRHRSREARPRRSLRRDKVFELGGPAVNSQPSRLDHVCYRTEDGFTVIDVWEDEQSFNAFGPIIGPALAGAGLDPKPRICRIEATMGADGPQAVYSAGCVPRATGRIVRREPDAAEPRCRYREQPEPACGLGNAQAGFGWLPGARIRVCREEPVFDGEECGGTTG